MANKTAKITAQQLYNLVLDTNKKTTELLKMKLTGEKTVLPFATRLSILFMVFGSALVLSIIFPVCKAFVGLNFDLATWNCIYLAYAFLTLTISLLSNIGNKMRIATTILAVMPLVVSVISTL